jgi:sporulation-control protein
MMKNILSSIGIGGASVDTVVERTDIDVGERLHGEVHVKVGTAEQAIKSVVLELVTRCLVEAGGDNRTYGEIVIASATVDPGGAFTAGETKVLPVTIEVPPTAPLSVGSTSTVLRTRLDIARAIDPRDSDRIRILPNRAMSAVFEGMEAAGFRLVDAEVEYNPRRAMPFVQEFDFKPVSFNDFGIEEVEISFSPAQDGIDVMLTVDNRGGLFTAGRERAARFRVGDADAGRGNMATELRRAIESLR